MINNKIESKMRSMPDHKIFLCLAKIAQAWMVDPENPSLLVSSKNLGADEISMVTEAFDEAGMWPDEFGNFSDTNKLQLPSGIIQETLPL